MRYTWPSIFLTHQQLIGSKHVCQPQSLAVEAL
ncbi:hypothetical protein GA0115235_10621, partial [Streptomyces sp. DpondAA-F4a]